MAERKYKYIVNDPSRGQIINRSIRTTPAEPERFITDRGEYSETEVYVEDDIVHCDTGVWLCIREKAAKGVVPGTDPHTWRRVASGEIFRIVPDKDVFVCFEDSDIVLSVSVFDAEKRPNEDITWSNLFEWEVNGVARQEKGRTLNAHVSVTDNIVLQTYTVRHESITRSAKIRVYAVDLNALVSRKDTNKLNELLTLVGMSDPDAYARIMQALSSLKSPYLDKTTNTWWEWDEARGEYVDTEVKAEGETTYSVTLSSYERVIKESGEGLRQELKVVTGDKQVTTQGEEVVTSQYSLSTHITVLQGSKELLYSNAIEEGAYTATLNPHGLTASVSAGNIIVTNVGDKGGHVDIEVNCEGKSIITKRFSVVIAKDGKNGSDGLGISQVMEFYGAGTETQEPSPSEWKLKYSDVELTDEKDCIWNKEIIRWTYGPATQSKVHIVYKRPKDGVSGSIVTNIEEWYAVSDSETTPPPLDTSDVWSTTPPQMSEDKPYLWNYSVTYFDNGTHFSSPKVVIGRWGKDAHSPYIDPVTGTWWVWDDAKGKYVDTNDPAKGDDGKSPRITDDGYWEYWDGKKWVKSDIKAKGEDGKRGPMTSIPVPHDPTQSYIGNEEFTSVVYDDRGVYYKAISDVPPNTPLSDRTYWQPISSIQEIGIHKAFIKHLFASQAFIDALTAMVIEAQLIKAGTNSEAPGGYNAIIDHNGEGHLAGGAIKFSRSTAEFAGRLKGAQGSFKELNCVDNSGRSVGGIRFDASGRMYFWGDIIQYKRKGDGYSDSLFQTGNLSVVGDFGHNKLRTLEVFHDKNNDEGGIAYVYVGAVPPSSGMAPIDGGLLPVNAISASLGILTVDVVLLTGTGKHKVVICRAERGKMIHIVNNSFWEKYIRVDHNKYVTIGEHRSMSFIVRQEMDINVIGKGTYMGMPVSSVVRVANLAVPQGVSTWED